MERTLREKTRTFLATLLLTAASLPLSSRASDPPLIIAHRAGTADYPENTLLAIRHAIDNRADGIWLTVQLSADGVPVLYRPLDLSASDPGAWRRIRLHRRPTGQAQRGMELS